jgi:hypothetical protein
MRAILIILLFSLGACSTPYQSIGFSGGVDAQQVTANTFRIVARGNAYTSGTTIQDYTLLKAAETTQRAGATHFMVISASDASRVSYTSGSATTHYGGGMAMTSYDPPEKYVKPGQDTYIRVVSIPAGQPAPPGTFAADEIVRYVGARVKRPT